MDHRHSLITIDITHSPYAIETGQQQRMTYYTASFGRLVAITAENRNATSSTSTVSPGRHGANTMHPTRRVLSIENEDTAGTNARQRARGAREIQPSATSSRTSRTATSRTLPSRVSTAHAPTARVSTARVSTAHAPTSRVSTAHAPTARVPTAHASAPTRRVSSATASRARPSARRPLSVHPPATSTPINTSSAQPSISAERRILRGIGRISALTTDELNQPPAHATENPKKKKAKKITEKRDSYIFGRIFCPVCFCDLLKSENEVQSIQCGHVFCKSCIKKVQKNDKNCPTCRAHVIHYHAIYLPQYED